MASERTLTGSVAEGGVGGVDAGAHARVHLVVCSNIECGRFAERQRAADADRNIIY